MIGSTAYGVILCNEMANNGTAESLGIVGYVLYIILAIVLLVLVVMMIIAMIKFMRD